MGIFMGRLSVPYGFLVEVVFLIIEHKGREVCLSEVG